jgi:2'-hydroxyisoflavone reductase
VALGLAGCKPGGSDEAPAPLRILVLGGTKFIGPPLVRYAIERGHTVSIFNRGKTNTHLFPEIEKLRGDRNGDIAALEGREWDAVIDNSANLATWVRDSAQLLKDSAGMYLFTSSISAFGDNSIVGQDESGPVATLPNPEDAEITDPSKITGENFGGLKALGEAATREAFGERATIVRPGLIVGPDDPSGRFTYWPVRIHRGGEVLAPGEQTDRVQFIDVRDLARWYVHLVENRTTGLFSATGPAEPMTISGMLDGIRAAVNPEATFTWVNAEFLEQHSVAPWMDMPVWVPPTEGYEGFSTFDCSKAIAAGLTFRPLGETASDTLEWYQSLPAERQENVGGRFTAEREAEVLAAWHAREQGS